MGKKGKSIVKKWIGSLAAIMVLVVGNTMAQQKTQFTQYMFNTLVINPAYAGADDALSLTFIQRNQWSGVEAAPSTQTFSAHTLVRQRHFGLGLTIVNDKIGVHKNLNILTNYAYHLRVAEKSFLSMGLQAGIRNRKSNYSSLIGNGAADPKVYDPVISRTTFDFGMGVYFRSPRFHAGVAAPQLIPERYTINDTLSVDLSQTNLFFFAKYIIPVNENLDAEPSGLIKYLAGVPVSFDINLNLTYRKVLTLGLSYRKKESVDFLMKAQVTAQLQLGYAYDHPIGDIALISNGSHELMARYLFKYRQRKVTSPR
jgi:type IX secretion system PorP/SprF family membrane protein